MSAKWCPRVFVLLPVHNRREITRKFINCLAAQTYPKVQLVLIDDGSNDGTAEMVKEVIADARIIKGNGKWWWSGCMQAAYRWLHDHGPAPEDLVLLVNDDITFESDFIANAVKTLEEIPQSLLGAQLRDPLTGDVRESGVHADLRRFEFHIAESPRQINCLPTRALLLRWVDMRRIGGFHPHMLPHYWADYEYTIRATNLGLRCVTHRAVFVTADLDATGDRDLDSLVGWHLVSRLFSIKTPLNPVYRTSFAILASSGMWKIINVLNIWGRAGFRVLWQGMLRQKFPRNTLAASI